MEGQGLLGFLSSFLVLFFFPFKSNKTQDDWIILFLALVVFMVLSLNQLYQRYPGFRKQCNSIARYFINFDPPYPLSIPDECRVFQTEIHLVPPA
jgi:hypothetical protein